MLVVESVRGLNKALMDIIIDFKLTGAGWSECVLEIYGQSCTVTASYLSDALRELISGVNHILSGGNDARFRFDEEPGEYRWILGRVDAGAVSVRILEFPELWGDKPDSEGKVIFDVTCSIRELAHALLSSLNSLLTEIGLDGYKEKWINAEFPLEEYKKLCAHLGVMPANPPCN